MQLDSKRHNMRILNHLLQIPVLKHNTLLEKPYREKGRLVAAHGIQMDVSRKVEDNTIK